MSFSVDTNILLYASNRFDPIHEPARQFLEERVAGGELFCLTWPAIMGFVRMATHPSIFRSPLTQDEAEKNITRLLSVPHVRALGEDNGFWQSYLETASDASPVRGNLVPDAHIAAILKHHGIKRFYTRDRDFRRFDFLNVVDPFANPDRTFPR